MYKQYKLIDEYINNKLSQILNKSHNNLLSTNL